MDITVSSLLVNLLLGSGDDVGSEVDGGEGALKGHICILNCN